ncbi:MAG: TolC family protein [Bacteroidales bacterium]
MNKLIVAAMLLTLSHAALSQKTVTLWQCYDSAAVATPLSGEGALYTEMSSLRDKNLAAAYLPALDVNGSFVYNSDILDIAQIYGQLPIPPEVIPSIPHEQYRATFDVGQVIWDGGVTRSARAVEQVVNELNMKQNEADVYRLREQVNNYYFSVLLVSSQIDVTEILISDLEARIREASSGVTNGVVTPVTVDVLTAEKIKAGQQLTELTRRRQSLVSALEQITGMTGLQDASFPLPVITISGEEIIDNPDMRLFEVRSRQLEMSKDLLKSQRMPKAFGFAQAAYGNPPGSNFFSETADFYYSVGAGFKWNIFDWNKNSNERKSLSIQQELIDIRRSAAEESLQRLLTLKMAEINAQREAAEQDEELIRIRTKIAGVAASQLENGTITASQYLTELNNEKQAVISAAVRQIGISRAQVDYIYITGNNK